MPYLCVEQVIDKILLNFLKKNNALCKNRFKQKVYDRIADQEDKEFYFSSSCKPRLIFRPAIIDKTITFEVSCCAHSITRFFRCGNPYSRINKILAKRLSILKSLEITESGLNEVFLPMARFWIAQLDKMCVVKKRPKRT